MTVTKNLRSVIRLIDDLRDCGIDTSTKISLPRIAVIGTQSAGKSSLLESIVGIDFLPRGDGVVTRRPLELRLVHMSDEDFVTYAVFEDEPDLKIEDFEVVKQKIEEKTNKIAGGKKNIVSQPIILNVYSYDCPNLSLVDLPGITRVPLANSDQPEDIERITTDMTMKYIEDERTIILCVISANTDVSTSDALKLARKVDKEGQRTLGVLTKVDIMDRGTSAMPILKNEVIKLTHGYIAVKNRSQADITNKVSVKDALEEEEKYFMTHREFKAIPDQVGTQNLSCRLTTLLHEHIIECLPEIEEEIRENLDKCERNLHELGHPFPVENGQKLYFLLTKAQEIGTNLKDIMEGRSQIKPKGPTGNQFQGYAHFNLLISKFNKAKHKLFIEGLKHTSPVDVILDIVEYKGISLPGFLPKEILEKKVSGELEKLKIPIRDFITDVRSFNEDYLKAIFERMQNVAGEVRSLLQSVAIDYLDSVTQETRNLIETLIEVEKDMIWTADVTYFMKETQPANEDDSPSRTRNPHSASGNPKSEKIDRTVEFIKTEIPDFGIDLIKRTLHDMSRNSVGKTENLMKLQQLRDSKMDISNLISEEEIVNFYEKLIKYYNVINRNMSDTVTKIIGVKMIKNYSKGLENYFSKYISEHIGELDKLKEDDNVFIKRKNYKEIYEKLQKSVNVLHKFNLTMQV